MNDIKKLKSMGFRKTEIHKVIYDSTTYELLMVPDIEEVKIEYKDGKRIQKNIKKIHPKSDSFWYLKYNENCILWCLAKNHQINKIWIEDKSIKDKSKRDRNKNKESVELIFDLYNIGSSPLQGRNQIMDLFPKEIKRDFLLDQLFGF
jgi:hypothetical protein